MNIVLVIPILDDWESAALLGDLIDRTFAKHPTHRVSILFVDDGSFASDEALRRKQDWNAIQEIDILRLRRNVGHQRAIAVGLAYLENCRSFDVAVIMDGDGEDLPSDIPDLLAQMTRTSGAQIVFAERGRRPEGLLFRSLYLAYRAAHRVVTGRGIRYGNFSAVPFALVRRLTVTPEIWSHYTAAVLNARIPYSTVRVDRGHRLAGKSKMNLESLVLHGLMAIGVYRNVGVRVLLGSAALCGVFLLLALGIVTGRPAAVAVPGWTPIMLGLCLVLICVITFSSVLYVFTSLSFRLLMGVLPARDYVYFVDQCERVYPAGAEVESRSGHAMETGKPL